MQCEQSVVPTIYEIFIALSSQRKPTQFPRSRWLCGFKLNFECAINIESIILSHFYIRLNFNAKMVIKNRVIINIMQLIWWIYFYIKVRPTLGCVMGQERSPVSKGAVPISFPLKTLTNFNNQLSFGFRRIRSCIVATSILNLHPSVRQRLLLRICSLKISYIWCNAAHWIAFYIFVRSDEWV